MSIHEQQWGDIMAGYRCGLASFVFFSQQDEAAKATYKSTLESNPRHIAAAMTADDPDALRSLCSGILETKLKLIFAHWLSCILTDKTSLVMKV